MSQFLIRRLSLLVPTLLGMSLIVFLMVRLLPGNIVDIITAGDTSLTDAQRAESEDQYGLSGSLLHQYWEWLKAALQGDFGTSLRNTTPVSETLVDALPITLELVFLGLLIAVVVGVPL